MIYAGIGARKTPQSILKVMYSFAGMMARKGHILRSGAADGADAAFELGCDKFKGKKEIYLPYKNFNGHPSKDSQLLIMHFDIARANHPYWDKIGKTNQKFAIRNVSQVLGKLADTPADFVVCYTDNGKDKGGTGQAIRVAYAYDIPVFNLFSMSPQQLLSEYKKLEAKS